MTDDMFALDTAPEGRGAGPPPAALLCASIVSLVVAVAIAVTGGDSLVAQLAAWFLSGVAATVLAALYSRGRAARGLTLGVGWVLSINAVALAVAFWCASFVTRRFW